MKDINRRIAVMILGPLGDVINTSCTFKQLRNHYPNSEISIITTDRGAPATVGIPEIDNVFVLDQSKKDFRKVIDTIKFGKSLKGKFDTVIVLDNSLRAALCAFATGAKRRIGRGRELRELFLTDIIPYLKEEKDMKIHVSEHYARCLKPMGCYKKDMDTSFEYSEADGLFADNLLAQNNLKGKAFIGFCPACHLEEKSLLIQDAAEIINKINKQGKYKVIIIGGKDVNDYVNNLKSLQYLEFTDFTGQTTFAQTAALIDRCEKFISVDTACMHLALARKTPTYAIFFSNLSTKWGPKKYINNGCLHGNNKRIDVDYLLHSLNKLSDKSAVNINKE